jgi:hypothetical protein
MPAVHEKSKAFRVRRNAFFVMQYLGELVRALFQDWTVVIAAGRIAGVRCAVAAVG